MRFLSNPRVWIVAGLLCLGLLLWVICSIVDIGDPPQPVPLGLRFGLLALLYAGAALVWGVFALINRRNNAQVLAGMGGDEMSRGVEAEERQVREKFLRAMEQLKTRRFGSDRGSLTLYELPWYVIIGSPGSGKTTAILHSGLDFPLQSVTGDGSLGGVGGTRNCDWWITSEAVLLDTAGRYTTQDSHQASDARGWHNFLALLRRYRKRRPINGVLVSLSMDELLGMNAEQRAAHARTLRARLDELREQLKLDIPAYLLVTKTDLLAGFRDFFDQLDPTEQDQPWGFTFKAAEEHSPDVKRELDLLSARLYERLPGTLLDERDLVRRQSIVNFPWQFENVVPLLMEIVGQVFGPQGMMRGHRLRGVYFTSAVQQGSPIERFLAGVAASFGVRGSFEPPQRASRSLFLRRMFREIVFEEANLAGTNIRYEKQLRLLRACAFLGMAGLGVVFALGWASAFSSNKMYMGRVLDYAGAHKSVTASSTGPELVASLSQIEKAASVYDEQSHPLLSNLGMYDGSVDEAAKSAYERALEHGLLPAIGEKLGQWLTHNADGDYDEVRNALAAYLMLEDPELRDEDFIDQWLASNPVTGVEQENGAELVRQFGRLRSHNKEYRLEDVNQRAVSKAQAKLLEIAPETLVYMRIERDFDGQVTDLHENLGTQFGALFTVESPDKLTVSSLYTRDGYDSVDLGPGSPYIDDYVEHLWVLGKDGGTYDARERMRIASLVEQHYAANYIAAWRDIVNAPMPVHAADTNALIDQLARAADTTNSPISLAIATIANNTALKPRTAAAENALEKVADRKLPKTGAKAEIARQGVARLGEAVPPSAIPQIAAAFADLHRLNEGGATSKSAQIASTLGELRQWLSGIYLSADGGSAALQASTGAALTPARRTRLLAAELPSPVNRWVMHYADSADRSVASQAANYMNQGWNARVAGTCKSQIAPGFPINRASKSDIALNDFNDYFRPNGVEDEYVKTTLASLIDRNSWRARDVGTFRVSSATLQTLQAGQRIRDAYFAGGGSGASVPYRVTPMDMDAGLESVTLQIGEHSVLFEHFERKTMDLQWPEPLGLVTVIFNDLNGVKKRLEYNGPWALHRAIAQGNVQRESNGSLLVAFVGMDNKTVSFRIASNSRVNPFDPQLFTAYGCRNTL